jgi:hypothetical protein
MISVLIGCVAVAASKMYYLREMFAALILFAVLFSSVLAVLLTLFLLDRAGEATIAWIGMRAKEALHRAHGLNLIVARRLTHN